MLDILATFLGPSILHISQLDPVEQFAKKIRGRRPHFLAKLIAEIDELQRGEQPEDVANRLREWRTAVVAEKRQQAINRKAADIGKSISTSLSRT